MCAILLASAAATTLQGRRLISEMLHEDKCTPRLFQDGRRASNQQCSQLLISVFRYPPDPLLAAVRVVDNRRCVLDQVGLEIVDQYGQSLELLVGASKSGVLLQLVEHILHGSRRLPDVAAPKQIAKPRHINRNISKVDVQIADMPEALPRLFDVPKPHRQMEPVKNMRHGLPCYTEHDALQPDVSVAENSDVAARLLETPEPDGPKSGPTSG